MEETLLEVAIRTNKACDKISHGYCPTYQKYFGPLRGKSDLRLVEIGVLGGISLQVFKNYFHPSAHIHGIDITNCSAVIPSGCHFTQFDTRVPPNLRLFCEREGYWDIIIDDGGHDMLSQQNSIQYLWSNLKSGGLFVMEDIHSSFMERYRPADHNHSTYHLMKCLGDPNSTFTSPWLDEKTFLQLREDISSVEIYQRDPNLWTDSITSVVRKR